MGNGWYRGVKEENEKQLDSLNEIVRIALKSLNIQFALAINYNNDWVDINNFQRPNYY